MSNRLKLDYGHLLQSIKESEIFDLQSKVNQCHQDLINKTGKGNDFLGWMDLASNTESSLINEINKTAKKLQDSVDVLLVIGIGGSYLGARAVIESLSHSFYNFMPKSKSGFPQIIYAGHHLDGSYHQDLIEYLEDKSFAINIISKSGTTTEPALAFRIFRDILEKKVGKEKSKELIVATTDKARGALKTLADNEGYQCYVIPDDVGGRYSVLTPVGLLPIAVSGISINELIDGAVSFEKVCEDSDINNNPAYFYAVARNILYNKGFKSEILVNYIPALQYIGEWWKQLYGESEGKDGKGIFPACCNFTTDLHSMGQWIQEGERTIFETILSVDKRNKTVLIEEDKENLDKLNFLVGKDMDYVNNQAKLGTALAHLDGGVANMTINLPELNAYYIGQLIYFFERACAMSGYLLEVNPFDQPGVEAYKKNMFALIDKPGSEDERKELLNKINNAPKGKVI